MLPLERSWPVTWNESSTCWGGNVCSLGSSCIIIVASSLLCFSSWLPNEGIFLVQTCSLIEWKSHTWKHSQREPVHCMCQPISWEGAEHSNEPAWLRPLPAQRRGHISYLLSAHIYNREQQYLPQSLLRALNELISMAPLGQFWVHAKWHISAMHAIVIYLSQVRWGH